MQVAVRCQEYCASGVSLRQDALSLMVRLPPRPHGKSVPTADDPAGRCLPPMLGFHRARSNEPAQFCNGCDARLPSITHFYALYIDDIARLETLPMNPKLRVKPRTLVAHIRARKMLAARQDVRDGIRTG